MRAKGQGRRVWVGLVSGAILFLAGQVYGQEALISEKMPACRPPLSICKPYPVLSPYEVKPWELCPAGSTCTCVPSCPNCKDCAVFVCVPDGSPECKTACDCAPGVGCVHGWCLPDVAPVYCCESEVCPAGAMCQHRDGSRGRCGGVCVDELWLCEKANSFSTLACGEGRVCACTASCPFCEDCGPRVCIPEGAPSPYRCGPDQSCALPGDRCVCVPSCPECDDCRLSVCVPPCDVPSCDERLKTVTERIDALVDRASRCEEHRECVKADTSTECQATCGDWVNRRYKDRVEKVIDRLDKRVCSEYREDGCPRPIPICAFERGLCVDGQCRGISVMPIPVPPDDRLEEVEIPGDRLLELERKP